MDLAILLPVKTDYVVCMVICWIIVSLFDVVLYHYGGLAVVS